ncbi:MAG: PorT family protein [Cytophagales bacterium]|nr:MAG: PorT family protein [Cytophagales bacterium]
MKQLLFIFCFCLTFANGYSQKIMFGPKIGVNISQLKTTDIEQLGNSSTTLLAIKNIGSNYTGFVAGGFFRASFAGFYVQPEVMLSLKGGVFEKVYRSSVGLPPETVKVNMLGVDVPVLLGYKMLFFRTYLGPVAHFRISNLDDLKTTISQINSASNSADSAVKRAVWGYQAGIGIDILKFTIDLKYEGNLSKITSLNVGNGLTLDQSTSLWQVTVGYNIL